MVGIDTPAAEREAVRKSLGLDDPVMVQFVRYFADAAQFKFGISYQFRQPVSKLLAERMPATLELATCATIFALVFGILMGVYTLIAAVAEVVAVGIGFITDRIDMGWSTIIFLVNTGIALTIAWPLALWLTRPRSS